MCVAEGVRLKLDVKGQGGGKTLDVDGQESVGLENWTIFMDVIRVSPLTSSLLKVRGSSSLFPPYFPF